MEVRAYTDSHPGVLQSAVENATRTLTINLRLLEKEGFRERVQNKAQTGVSVRVIGVSESDIDDEISLSLAALEELEGHVCISPDTESIHAELISSVDVIADNKILICQHRFISSEPNHSDPVLVEVTDDSGFITQCLGEIGRIVSRYQETGSMEGATDKITIAKRLTAVKVLLELEDSSWKSQLEKINGIEDDDALTAIVLALQSEEPSFASSLIDDYITRVHALKVWEDPDASLKKIHLKILEVQIDALANEQSEMNRLLGEFEHQKVINLGDLIEEYLGLRARTFKEKADQEPDYEKQYQESQAEYEEFTESHTEAKKDERVVLTPEQKSEMKTLLRKLRQKCHPDKVPDELKEQAKVLFQQVDDAYKLNNIDLLKKMLEQVLAGDFSTAVQPEITDSIGIEERINRFKQELVDLLREIDNLINKPAWKIIGEYDDYAFFFDQQKEVIEREIERLREEVGHE